MADIIRLLPDSIANQIAAGEVIQRPASVIKELVENAIDAKATQIRIELQEAGRELIRVWDNGKGMSATDARMAFERHATSKIAKAEDLFALNTMGFRGEALASIVAVSQVELITRRKEEEIGTRLIIAGSVVESQEPITSAVGSTFSIRNLFYNVPARRKFLKNNDTELRVSLMEVERIALVNPEIAFNVFHNNKPLIQLAASPIKGRITDLFGKRYDRDMIPVSLDSPIIKISGYIGRPESGRKRGAKQFFFVNGRYMRHPFFHKAISSAYEHILPAGVQPNYFVYFEIDPKQIDVNIHPAKTEIKFADELTIFKFLGSLTRESLASIYAIPAINFEDKNVITMPAYKGPSSEVITSPAIDVDTNYNPFTDSVSTITAQTRNSQPNISWADLFNQFNEKRREKASSIPKKESESKMQTLIDFEKSEPMPDIGVLDQDPLINDSQASVYCHIYKGRYIVTSLSRGLALIDYHRAEVRIIYDHLIEDYNKGGIEQQRLLFPEEITVSNIEGKALKQIIEELDGCGFTLEQLTDTEYNVIASPTIAADCAGEMVTDLIQRFLDENIEADKQIRQHIALALAKRKATPYGIQIDQNKASQLIARLFASSEPTFTPDGRLIISIIEEGDIDRRFNS